MKVFKNKKQRFVAVFLSLVFAFMLVPFTDAYATSVKSVNGDSFQLTGTCIDDGDVVNKISFNSDYPIVVVKLVKNNSIYFRAYSLYPFSYSTDNVSGYPLQMAYAHVFVTTTSDSRTLYELSGINTCVRRSSGYYYTIENFGNMPFYILDTNDEFPLEKVYNLLYNSDSSGFDCTFAGGIEMPIYDEDIGTLIISKSKMYEESNGEDVNDLYNLFSWKMKTNTGFSLSENKYARTFIQVRVESKCVVYDDRRHTKIHKKFDNYGEKAMLINSHPVDSQPLKISYLTDIPNVLPKTHAETHNPVYAGYNYTLYFRVVCTDDLAVIPSDSSKWYCGGWRALDCNADILVGQSDTTENGSFDDEDNWVTDEDDGNNSIESGSDSVHDIDDAKDDFNNSSSAVDSSVNGAISTMQSLLDMIRHVPQIISTIFSFLPNWCLNIVGLAFVALVVLIIYKLVRG